jgi:murein DD-endopeptidase MepM/ murein hydrolase activator NlpD
MRQPLAMVSLLVLALLLSVPQPLFALSPEQRIIYDSNVLYYDIEALSIACGGSTMLVGSDNPEKVWHFLIGKGLTPIQAAGAMGNLQFEGGFNPRRVEDGWGFPKEMDTMPPNKGPQGQPGYGIVQWTSPDRKAGLVSLSQSRNLPVHDLALQLDYMWSELEGAYKSRALDPLRQATDLGQAVAIWQNKYEVGKHFEPRLKAAQQWLISFGSKTEGSGPSNDISCGSGEGSGEVTGGYSLPLDRKWYSKKEFSDPHHSGRAAIDLQVPIGTPVYSVTAGKVIDAPNGTLTGGYGLGVTIDAGNGVVFYYGHGSDGGAVPGAKQGDTVKPGQLIMHSASTGSSTGPHLHLEIRINGTRRCPQTLLVGIAEGNIPPIQTLPASGCTY